MRDRERNYDLLRSLAALAVILGHVSGTFLETFIWDFYDGLPGNHPLYTCIYTAVCRFSVPVFLMLSGAFVLANPKTEHAGSFYRKAWKQIGIPGFAAIVFAVLYSAVTGMFLDHTGIRPAFDALLSGAPYYHLWYLPVMLGIYLLAPLISRFKHAVSASVFCKVSLGMTAAGTLALWLNPPVQMHWNIGEAFCYTGFFMMGAVIKDSVQTKKHGWIYVVGGVLLQVLSGLLLYRSLLAGTDRALAEHRYIMSYTPLTTAASLLIFLGFAKMKIRVGTEAAAVRTYGVYLVHAFLLDLILRISRAAGGQRWLTHLDSRIAIPLLTILLYGLSLAVSELLHRLRRASGVI